MNIEDGIIINGEFHKKVMLLNKTCSQCSFETGGL
jgi:hypothetical protein